MVSMFGIFAGVAAVLAVIVTSLVIAVCLAVSRTTDTVRGARGRPQRRARGWGGAGAEMPPSPVSRHRNASGMPGVSRRGDR